MTPVLRFTLVVLVGLTVAAPARAQLAADYPKAAVTIVVPFGAGGPSDVLARLVAQRLQIAFGKPVLVENRPGAGGTLAAAQVAKSAPDGLTLIMNTPGNYLAAFFSKNLSFNPIKDFVPIINCASYPFYLVVNPSLPIHSVQDLVALAKKEPNKLNYSSVGIGGAGHLLMEIFKREAGIELVHVPFRSAPQSAMSIVSGETALAFDTIGTSQSLVAAGKLRGIAVTSGKRSASIPDVPTVVESGFPGFEAYLWVGLFAPAGTPDPIVEKLNREVNKIMQDAEVQRLVTGSGGVASPNSPSEFAAFALRESDKWRKSIADTGTKVE